VFEKKGLRSYSESLEPYHSQGVVNMSAKKKETLAQEQRRTKPKFEDIIATRASMDDEAKKVAYAFLDYCNAKNITYKWSSTNRWNLNMKGKSLGYIGIGERDVDDDSWNLVMNLKEILQYEDDIQKEGLAEFVGNNILDCRGCSYNCAKSATISGKEYHGICNVGTNLKNPNGETLKSVQKTLDFLLALTHGTASRPIIDATTNGLTRIDNKLRISAISDLQGNANENMDHLFNNKYNSYFYVGPYEHQVKQGIQNIVFQLDKPVELKMYSLVTGLRLDVPKKWALYGAVSEDGPWTLLDNRDEFPKPVTLYTEKAFKIASPQSYQYYQIKFEGWYFVVSQIHLYV